MHWKSIYPALEYNYIFLSKNKKPWEKPPCTTKIILAKVMCQKLPKMNKKSPLVLGMFPQTLM